MLNAAHNPSATLAIDTKSVSDLRQAARQNSPEALKATARQFEALFMNMVMKSMRAATPQEGVFDSQQSRMFTSMLDQQLSQSMASKGVGLADVLIRQLSNITGKPAADDAAIAVALPSRRAGTGWSGAAGALPPRLNPMLAPEQAPRGNAAQPQHVQAFLSRLAPEAEEASRSTGIPAKFMLGQAALESGWGKRQITAADGTASYNLFGIKASGNWSGRVVEASTTEYVDGVAQKKIEKFRAYDSYADSFRDYARLLRSNPRYENVLANAQDVKGFAQGLQNAGYATDPNYAAKLTRIIEQTFAG